MFCTCGLSHSLEYLHVCVHVRVRLHACRWIDWVTCALLHWLWAWRLIFCHGFNEHLTNSVQAIRTDVCDFKRKTFNFKFTIGPTFPRVGWLLTYTSCPAWFCTSCVVAAREWGGGCCCGGGCCGACVGWEGPGCWFPGIDKKVIRFFLNKWTAQ